MLAKFLKHLDLTLLIVVALSAVGVGYTSFAGSLWDGEMIGKYSNANAVITDANTSYLEYSFNGNEVSTAEQKETLARYEKEQKDYDELSKQAEKANKNGDQFMLYSVYFSIILFMGTFITIIKNRKHRDLLTIITIGVFAYSTIITMLQKLP